MKSLLFITCFTIFTYHCQGQPNQSKIDKRDLKIFIKILTSDSLEGRGTGTEGQRKAEKFISDRFKNLGLQPYDEHGYLEKFKLTQTYWGQVYLKTKSSTLTNFENMVLHGSQVQNEEIDKEVVFGGRGTEAEINQIEVKGRFVVVFAKNLRSYYDVNKKLSQRGASGIILANPDIEKQFESIKNTYKDYSLKKILFLPINDSTRNFFARRDSIRSINTIVIPNSEVKNVCGRSMRELTRLQKEDRIKEVPYAKIKIKFERIQNEIQTANVVGVVKGKSNKCIVVSAHYDHLGKSGREYFPGADDNASGTAALLEIAEAFSSGRDLEYNIVFLATSGEEADLLGSRYHVSQPGFDPKSILCNLNLDMISRSDEKHANLKYLYCLGAGQSKKLDAIIQRADSLFAPCSFDYSLSNLNDPTGLFTRSDNYSFYKKGVTAIHFFAGLHADYHQTTDTVEKIDFANFENRVRLISLVIELLQKSGEN